MQNLISVSKQPPKTKCEGNVKPVTNAVCVSGIKCFRILFRTLHVAKFTLSQFCVSRLCTSGFLSFFVSDFYHAMLAQSALRDCFRLSICPSVTFRYHVQIGSNSSKIISWLNSLRPMRSLTPNMGDLVQREHPQN